MGTLIARDVSDETVAGVDLAMKNTAHKAREAYFRFHCETTFGPTPEGRNATLGIVKRFAWVVETMIRLRKEYHVRTEFSVAAIARALGHPDTSTLDAYLRLEQPVSFSDGDRLCDLYGVDRKWLETGEGSPFYQRAKYRDAGEMFSDLYRKGCFYDHLIFVLSDEARGECSVFGVNNSHEYTLLAHNIPVHDDVGSSGYIDVVQFATLLGAIVSLKNAHHHFYARASGSNSLHIGYISSNGIILAADDYRKVEYGAIHPAQLLSGRYRSFQPWHEDLPDLEYGVTRYTDSYVRARDLYANDMVLKKITTNEQLTKHIAEILRNWQPSDFEVAQMLQKKDNGAQPWEYYSNFVSAARAGDDEARTHIASELFWGTRIAMPDWLDHFKWLDAHPETHGAPPQPNS